MSDCAKQGYGDSLCGVYSLLNAICHFEAVPKDDVLRQREIFSQLIMAADRLGYLDHQHVVVGFEAFELIEIFNWVAERFGYELQAVNLCRLSSASGTNLTSAVSKELKKKNVAITYDNTADHWVAITENPAPLDSWPLAKLVPAGRAKRSNYGLIIQQISQD